MGRLKEKCPEPRNAADVAAAHVEKVALQIKGGAGPGGTLPMDWQDFLLRYGAHSMAVANGRVGRVLALPLFY